MVEYRQLDISRQAERNAVSSVLYAAIGKGDYNDAMFHSDNWGHCTTAFIAEENDEIVGVTTFTVNGRYRRGFADISVVYTKPEHRQQGIAKLLFMEALKCLMTEAPDRPIVVDVLSEHVARILMGLPPELKQNIRTV